MSAPVFPLSFAGEELRLLTAIGLGFLFGFSLERAGFGNARKLAAQFYLRDMTVFKVMFTAILVAMVGVYALSSLGLVDLSMMWINPTFLWAQVVGGFLLGVGFIMSGLCPGTSVVSAASGRWDAWATFAGIFVGTFAFVAAVDLFPALEGLYSAGEMGVSVLPTLLGVPPLVFALGVVALAAAAFVGAEWVERRFGDGPVGPGPSEEGPTGASSLPSGEATPWTPVPAPATLAAASAPVRGHVGVRRAGWAVVPGLLLVVGVVGLTGARPAAEPSPTEMQAVDPLVLAEEIVTGDPSLFIVDLRGDVPSDRIPGAYAADGPAEATELLKGAPAGSRVVVYDAEGALRNAPVAWPDRLSYRYVQNGWIGWQLRVLTPAPRDARTLADRAWVERQNQLSAWFTGAAVESAGSAPAPLPMPSGGAKKPKKPGGC